MKTYVFVITVAMLAGAFFSPATIAGQNRSGQYRRGSTGTIRIQDIGRGKNHRLALWIVVGQREPSCSGAVEGKARFTSKTVAELVLTDCGDKTNGKVTTDGEAENCRIKLVFSGGSRLIVEEGDNCHRCHGFSCVFDGTYFKKAQAAAAAFKKRTAKENRRSRRRTT